MYKKFQSQNNVPISAKYVHWCIFCGFEVSVKIGASNIQLLVGSSFPPEEGVTSCSPILQSGSLELIKYHWLAPLFSQAPIVSFCPWDVTTLVPSPHPGFVVTNGLTMLQCSMCSKKAVDHKIGYKGPVWSLLSGPQYQCFYHQFTGS